MSQRSRHAVSARWLPFLGKKMGLARFLSTMVVDPDDFDLHQVFPETTSFNKLFGTRDPIEFRAGGAGIRLEEATNRAMGELLERYASFAFGESDRIVASCRELAERGLRAVPLETLATFTRTQLAQKGFPYGEFTADTPVGWFEGVDSGDGLPIRVPGQLVSLGYRASPGEASDCFYATSSGCAVGTSPAAALVSGLLEVVERDAVMVRWYARLPPPRLDFHPADLLGRRSVEGLDVHFHDLTVDGEVPVVGVTCIEDSGRPCFFILSAAAGVDMLSAARKAMTEAGQGRPFIKTIALTQESSQADGVFNDFDRNLRFYAEPANRHFIAWFLGNSAWSERRAPAVDEAREPTDQLTRLLGKCSHMGLRPIVFDMTLPEMRDRGLFACRVIVPELVPLCVPSAPFLGHPRLAGFMDAAKRGGVASHVPEWLPHPFP